MCRNRARVLGTAFVVWCAAGLVAASAHGVAADAHAPPASAPGSMVLLGSSSMNGIFGHLIAQDFTQLGFRVTRKGYSAAGLARPDFRDLARILSAFPIQPSDTSVLLYIGGNDAQSLWLRPEERNANDSRPWVSWRDARWSAIYERRMIEMIDAACARGARHVFVLPPADVSREHLQARLERVRKLQQQAAAASQCGRYIATMGDRGHFVRRGQPLRATDGVHMNRSGAQRVWARARAQVFALLGYTELAQCESCRPRSAVRRRAPRSARKHSSSRRARGRVLLTDVR